MDINPSPTLITASRGVRFSAVAALSVLALFLLVQTWSVVDSIGRTTVGNIATITVTGTGKASMAPNIAQISFTVEENASTVAAAQDSATKRTNDALAALKKLSIAEKDIQTTGYQVSPQYETRPCTPGMYCPQTNGKITGYQVTQSVNVKVRDTKKTGDVLQALGTLNVQNISGPNFMHDDDSAVTAEARGKAIADARAKAKILAGQLGVRLGKVVGFSESGGGYPVMYERMTKSASVDAVMAPAPSIPVGENETTSNVTVTYEIK